MKIANMPYIAGMKRPAKRDAPRTEAELTQYYAEVDARIQNRLFEAMWPSRKSAKVVNCDDYDPLGE